MRVKGPNGTGGVYASQPNAKRTGGGTFSLPQTDGVKSTQTSRAPVGLGSLDALIGLQQYADEPQERRRKALKKGHSLLDQLDELKIAILSGRIEAGKLEKLVYTLSQSVELADSPALKDLMEEIELRARVELAKLGHSQA